MAWSRLLLRVSGQPLTQAVIELERHALQDVVPSNCAIAVRPLFDEDLEKLVEHFKLNGCEESAAEVADLASLAWLELGVRDPESPAAFLHSQTDWYLPPFASIVQVGIDSVPLSERDQDEGCKKTPVPCPEAKLLGRPAQQGGIGAGAKDHGPVPGCDPSLADVEGAWSFVHQCLHHFESDLIHRLDDPLGNTAHGSGVLSLLAAAERCGHFGIAPGLRVFLSPVRTRAGPNDEVRAITRALLRLKKGDVLLLEIQAKHSTCLVPAEFWLPVFHLVHAATRCGITVVEAAGNGRSDLDCVRWPVGGLGEEDWPDSGAILVGGSTNEPQDGVYSRWRCSNFGRRIKAHAWAEGVQVAGAGYRSQCLDATSAATAIVAGCAVVAQRLSLRNKRRLLCPSEVKELLENHGTPVREGGCVPDLVAIKAAICALPDRSPGAPT